MAPARTTTRFSSQPSRGLTLAEMLIVLSVLAILCALLVPTLGATLDRSKHTVTAHSLEQLRVAIVDHYYADHAGQLPGPRLAGRAPHPQLVFLYSAETAAGYDPVTATGWRGPYVKASLEQGRYRLSPATGFSDRYGLAGDAAPLDAWGRPVVLQQPQIGGAHSATDLTFARLVSAGPNGVLDTPPDVLLPAANQRGDDLVLPLGAVP